MPVLAVPFALVGGDAEADDDGLVRRLRAGHLSALGDAYDAHHTHVRAFARRLLGDESAAFARYMLETPGGIVVVRRVILDPVPTRN